MNVMIIKPWSLCKTIVCYGALFATKTEHWFLEEDIVNGSHMTTGQVPKMKSRDHEGREPRHGNFESGL